MFLCIENDNGTRYAYHESRVRYLPFGRCQNAIWASCRMWTWMSRR